MEKSEVLKRVAEVGLVPVIRAESKDEALQVVEAIGAGGVPLLEITMTVPGALAAIEAIKKRDPKAVVGAGTVLDPETARQVILAGATFIVAPTLNLATIEMCHRYDVAAMPGCFTPTEILTAWQAGADIVKVFPATALGPQFFKDIRGPLPQIKMMPTGGVSLTNAGDWIAAGAVAVGVGTALLDPQAIAESRFDVIADNARTVVAAVAKARA